MSANENFRLIMPFLIRRDVIYTILEVYKNIYTYFSSYKGYLMFKCADGKIR